MTAPNRFRFRAWDGHRMVYDFSIYAASGVAYDTFIADGVRTEQRYPVDGKIMQSTGLLDKNGVEIFEGDLFRYTNERGEAFTLEVSWFEHGWYGILPGCKNDHEYDYEIALYDIPKEYEVVGNIYQSATPART